MKIVASILFKLVVFNKEVLYKINIGNAFFEYFM